MIRGHGRLTGERTVAVDGDGGTRTLTAQHAVVLATGTSATIPPIPGLREARPWTSRDVTNLRKVPGRVVVVGGGVVGCEATCWLNGLGAAVTLLVREDRLLPRAEPFAGELLADRLRDIGVDLRFGVSVDAVRRDPPAVTDYGRLRGNDVTVVAGDTEIVADEIVVAVGRTPNSDALGLETVGVKPGGYVATDDTMTVEGVADDWLYAVGDLTGRALLTHMGKYQARVCGDVIAARAAGRALDAPRFQASSDHERVPQVTFTDPQVASVGLTEAAATGAGRSIRVVDYDLGQVAGASLLRDDYTGQARLVVDRDREVLLGATFVGPEVAELVHAATVAVVGEVPIERLWHAVPSYPTVSEIWLRLLETWRADGH